MMRSVVFSKPSAPVVLCSLWLGALAACNGGSPPAEPEPIAPAATEAPSEALVGGAKTYQTYCAACHQADGTGRTPSGRALAGSFAGADSVLQKDDEALLQSIKVGRVGPIGSMPSWAGVLSEQERRDVLAHIRKTFGQVPEGTPPEG